MILTGCIVFQASANNFTEYEIKAGLIYNIISFIEWPESYASESGDSLTIGILGENPFGEAFKQVEGKPISGKKLFIKELKKGASDSTIFQCQALFISASEKDNTADIFRLLSHRPVLTISDFKGFVDQGGMISFIEQNKKIRFEINDYSAKNSGLKIPSSVKRLAVRVIGGPGNGD